MKLLTSLTLVAAACLLAAPAVAHAGPFRIVTSYPTEASIARAVGGSHVEVTSLSKADRDPHTITPRQSMAVPINRADLLITNGQDEDLIWLPTAMSAARNPEILEGEEGNFDPSENVNLIAYEPDALRETPFFGQSLVAGATKAGGGKVGVSHGNHHYLLDPANGVIVAHNIAERLVELVPASSAAFHAGDLAFAADMKPRIAAWDAMMAPFKGVPVVSVHRDWTYLIARHGLQLEGYVEPHETFRPSPDDMAKLIGHMREAKVKLILASNWQELDHAKAIAKGAGAEIVVLPAAVGPEIGVKDYPALFAAVYGKLVPALAAAKAKS